LILVNVAARGACTVSVMKILLAVDGSKHSLKAVDALIAQASWYREAPQVELVTVHLPVPKLRGMGVVVGKDHEPFGSRHYSLLQEFQPRNTARLGRPV
jgi:hypothetical protein